MIEVSFNGRPQAIASDEAQRLALEGFDAEPRFELWLSVPDGPSMCMLRNGPHAWLMYLREPGDHGFASEGDAALEGVAHYTLSNGQVDEYPLSWCIGLPQCHAAIAFFFASEGRRPDGVTWRES
ncbi:MAG TPA: Imm1 family immunity protein [Variovorax sp.]